MMGRGVGESRQTPHTHNTNTSEGKEPGLGGTGNFETEFKIEVFKWTKLIFHY